MAVALTRNKQMQRITEVIGRVATNLYNRVLSIKNVDETKVNYYWWDRFRRGMLDGYRYSGLFAKPITEILSAAVLGTGIAVTLAKGDAYTDALLKAFVARIQSMLMTLVIDLYALGDQFIVVNPDGSLSIPSPETVETTYDALDYRRLVAVTIKTTLNSAIVKDVYTAESRTVEIRNQGKTPIVLQTGRALPPGESITLTYENLLGRIPVVHFANDRATNETNGRPVYEAMLRLFSDYDDLVDKMVEGARLMGNPIPVFEGMENIDETIEANSEPLDEQYYDDNGIVRNRVRLTFDRLSAIVLGKGGSFKFASPPQGFTTDLRGTLKMLFMLIMEFTRIPDGLWGTELGSARATFADQLQVFHQYIESRRVALAGEGPDAMGVPKSGLLELIDLWLSTKALTDNQVQVGAVRIKWPVLSKSEDQQNLNWASAMYDRGLITATTFVELSARVEDADAEVEAAKADAASRVDPFEQAVNNDLTLPPDNPDPAVDLTPPRPDDSGAVQNDAFPDDQAAA